ncbi:DUF2971 domain-containing protein [Sphingomicrobium aestuariivivum]|uniref:DUF2971 domain-containing protein n=1 Tax=Sphingomicrobium aestuariivivum TaxID=1582356 RepID=UPI001FD67F3D|nr:DUF2971 domain-containing protein [Sphingomicrobium aestuariivivum]MCJ8189896.1 DUF2971 domain-containing protein [Sphingomicrobium aestuariivivum]
MYKYVTAERLDVLKHRKIRFTPPVNTNDIFEVRQTFDLLAGPKLKEFFAERVDEIDVDEQITEALKGTPLAGMTAETVRTLFSVTVGGDMDSMLRAQIGSFLNDQFFPTINASQSIDNMLTKLGSDLICLSLTERFDSSPMWAHYAGNSSGFVIAFDTNDALFLRGEEGSRQGLQKITYFDGTIPELMDDPYAALMSKQLDWQYEREWRLYLKAEEAAEIREVGNDLVHLVEFQKTAVQRVVLGLRAAASLEAELSELLERDYPGVGLSRVRADRTTASLIEEKIF